MARLFPFRALRYDPTRVNLTDVVTQPYDKITPAMQDAYYAASPHNLIRVILGKHLPADTEAGQNVYTLAASTLNDWRAEGILKEESEPALYGYSQTYTVPGTDEVRERRGFIALGQLHDYADKVVYRHEQTFPKHKSDRLALFKATRAYCEQIYMLYSDPESKVDHLLFDSEGMRAPDVEITDEYDVLHRLWKVTDPTLIQHVLDLMADKWLLIADGHHRYETSTTYMHERAAALGLDPKAAPAETPVAPGTSLPAPAFPEQAMMMTFVNIDAPGITILPTHRVAFNLIGFNGREFATKAADYFTVTEIHTTPSGHYPGPDILLHRLNETEGVAFIAATRDGDFLLTPRPEAIAPLLAGLPRRQQQLDVTQLHKVILEKLLNLNEETVRAGGNIRYLREASEALQQVGSGNADVAFLIKPVTLEQMKDISLNLEVMPQKSTDFYPKLLSGLAMYTLD
jgi:uncharacterized protein (DUF1015 family)